MKTSILIIEDEKKIATLVAKNLEAAGYAVSAAEDGESFGWVLTSSPKDTVRA